MSKKPSAIDVSTVLATKEKSVAGDKSVINV